MRGRAGPASRVVGALALVARLRRLDGFTAGRAAATRALAHVEAAREAEASAGRVADLRRRAAGCEPVEVPGPCGVSEKRPEGASRGPSGTGPAAALAALASARRKAHLARVREEGRLRRLAARAREAESQAREAAARAGVARDRAATALRGVSRRVEAGRRQAEAAREREGEEAWATGPGRRPGEPGAPG